MINGVHAPNGGITEADLDIIRAGGIRSVKLMWYHSQTDIRNLRDMGVDTVYGRLPDSTVNGRIKAFWEWGGECVSVIKANPYVKNWQLDCEANLQWRGGGGNEWAYQWLVGKTLDYIKAQDIPPSVRFGLCPFSYADVAEATRWQKACLEVTKRFDFVCADAYWQGLTGKYITWGQFGGVPETVHGIVPDKPIVVTEYGNSSCDETNPPPQHLIEQAMATYYPQYLRFLQSLGYVEAAFAFLVGGTPQWVGFRINEATAVAIGSAL